MNRIEIQRESQERAPAVSLKKMQLVSRVEIMAMQIAYIVDKTTTCPEIKAIVKKGIIDQQWIDKVTIEAYNEENQKFIEIQVVIDWERWRLNVISGGTRTLVPESFSKEQNLSDWINEIIQAFNRNAVQLQLQTRAVFRYTPEICEDATELQEIQKSLNLRPATAMVWAPEKEINHYLTVRPDKLDELTVSLHVAI